MAAGQATSGRFAAERRLAIVKTQSPEVIRGTSILRSSPALVILAIVAMSTVNFAGPDLWRYLLGGRIFLTTGHLPLRDTFSYTAYGLPWLQHEWLAQTIMTLFYAGLGGFGLKILKLGCDAAIICLLAAAMSETGAPARVQRPVLILVALALAPQMQFRPQLFTDVLLAVLVALMAAETYRRSRRLWIAIPLFAVWANLHGGFVVGLAALALYAGAVMAFDLWARHGLAHGARLTAITAGCAAATLLNPFGINAWLIVLHTVRDPFVSQYIVEWMSLPKVLAGSIGSTAAVIYIIPILLVVALAAVFVMTPTLDDAAMMAVAAMFALCAVEAVRNMQLAVIAAAIPLTRHAGLVARRRERSLSLGSHPEAGRANLRVQSHCGGRTGRGARMGQRAVLAALPAGTRLSFGRGRIYESASHPRQHTQFVQMGWLSDVPSGPGEQSIHRRTVESSLPAQSDGGVHSLRSRRAGRRRDTQCISDRFRSGATEFQILRACDE